MPTQRINLEEVYQDAAASMAQCMRAVADVVDSHSQLDLDPKQLTDLIADLMSTLVVAQVHVDAMASTKRLLDRGYKNVNVQMVNVGHPSAGRWEGDCGICGDARHATAAHGKG